MWTRVTSLAQLWWDNQQGTGYTRLVILRLSIFPWRALGPPTMEDLVEDPLCNFSKVGWAAPAHPGPQPQNLGMNHCKQQQGRCRCG